MFTSYMKPDFFKIKKGKKYDVFWGDKMIIPSIYDSIIPVYSWGGCGGTTGDDDDTWLGGYDYERKLGMQWDGQCRDGVWAFKAFKAGLQGIYDNQGRTIVPVKYSSGYKIDFDAEAQCFTVKDEDGNKIYYSKNGKRLKHN